MHRETVCDYKLQTKLSIKTFIYKGATGVGRGWPSRESRSRIQRSNNSVQGGLSSDCFLQFIRVQSF